jgi:hypothetical protein
MKVGAVMKIHHLMTMLDTIKSVDMLKAVTAMNIY